MTSGIRDATGAFYDCIFSGGTAQPATPEDRSHPRNCGPSFSLLPERHLHLPLQHFLKSLALRPRTETGVWMKGAAAGLACGI